MSSFRIGEEIESRHVRDEDGVYLEKQAPALRSGRLSEKAELVCRERGLSFSALSPRQKLFLTHYKCTFCKLVPLHYLDLRHHNKARCGKCGQIVSFTGTGKYGKMRKKLALLLKLEEDKKDVS